MEAGATLCGFCQAKQDLFSHNRIQTQKTTPSVLCDVEVRTNLQRPTCTRTQEKKRSY